jgi:dTMP kinase
VPSQRRGRLIAFEGVEGAGKSTQLELLRQTLEKAGHRVVSTREPGGTKAGEQIRSILLDRGSTLDPRAEALLFAAARAQLVEQVVRPALERGETVLCDRYLHSSLAYQGVARGLGLEPVAAINGFATGGLLPDLVVLLAVDPAEGLDRVRGEWDRIEDQDLAFHQQVERGFMELAAADPERFVVVDAARPAEQVAAEVRAAVLANMEPEEG